MIVCALFCSTHLARTLASVPKTERKPEHRPKPNPLGSERSKNVVRMVEFPKQSFLEQ